MSLGGKWFPCATESYLLPGAFAANQGSNFPSDYFMLQFYKIFCTLWTQIWNWNSTFFYLGWWGGCLEMLLCWNGSPPSCRISAVGLWRKWKIDLNGLAATTHVRATFIPGLLALTCSNVILSAEARGVTTMLLSTPLAWEHRGFPFLAYLSIWLCHAMKVISGLSTCSFCLTSLHPKYSNNLY